MTLPTTRLVAFAVLLALAHGSSIGAEFFPPETRQVPLSRLVQNLEREQQQDPKNVATLIALARLHGMAFALKSDEVAVLSGEPDKPWYGEEPPMVPYAVEKSSDPERIKKDSTYLRRSIAYYREALAIEPANLLATLGLGWALDQSGDKKGAVVQYRRVIERAWPQEQNARVRHLGERFFTDEAARYLTKRLDPAADAAELAELGRRTKLLSELPRTITPVAVPLHDAVTLRDIVDPFARVAFDADGSGLRREWTWITPAAGWLVYDAFDEGRITSALQWFGNVTFWLFWDNGFEALRALDDNADGELAGRELQHLAIWHDRNRNGVSEAGEVRPLSAYDIVAVDCRFEPGDDRLVAAISAHGVRLANGRTRATYDIILERASHTSTAR